MATLKPTTVPAKRLAETISGASTTFKLNNIRSWAATATDLTSADFGDRLWAVFRNSTGTLMEIMEIDPTTITSASSPITIIARGLKFDGEDGTEVAANKLTWVKGDTVVELGTHVPQLISQFVDKVGDQTVNGIKTFSSFPVKSGSTSPTSAAEFATKAYVDAAATGNSTYNQNTFTGTAGETLVATDLCYFKQSDQRWWKADADAIATSVGVKLAIAQGGATAGNTLTLLGSGLNMNFSGLTISAPYFVSNTTGGISTTPGTFARFIGRAISATTLHFDPDNGNVVSKYGTEIYATDSVGTDSYAITTSSPFLALKDGMVVRFKAGTANTGAATLAVDGLTAKTIKKNFNVDLSDNDIKVNQIVTVVYDSASDVWQMQSQVANQGASPKFGGTGADGALSISSGATNIDLGNAQYVIKNYSSISITGTGSLTFTNPHASGTIIILKSQGAVTITSSTVPCIDTRSMGAAAATDGTGMFTRGTSSTVSAGGSQWSPAYTIAQMVANKAIYVACGSGGGNARTTGNAVGGRGGGGLYIECGGALNFTGTINTSGTIGGTGTGESGGAGGGSAGLCVICYASLTANSGTITATGGAGSAGVNVSAGTGDGGAGAGGKDGAGGTGADSGAGGAAGGAGAGGGGGSTQGGNQAGGSGGSSMGGFVFANTEFL